MLRLKEKKLYRLNKKLEKFNNKIEKGLEMKKLLIGLLTLCSLSILASETVIRLDQSTIENVFTEGECIENAEGRNIAQHTIFVETYDGKIIDIKTSQQIKPKAFCESGIREVAQWNADTLIKIHSIERGTVQIIEKKDKIVCATKYLDVVVNSELKRVRARYGEIAVKCP